LCNFGVPSGDAVGLEPGWSGLARKPPPLRVCQDSFDAALFARLPKMPLDVLLRLFSPKHLNSIKQETTTSCKALGPTPGTPVVKLRKASGPFPADSVAAKPVYSPQSSFFLLCLLFSFLH